MPYIAAGQIYVELQDRHLWIKWTGMKWYVKRCVKSKIIPLLAHVIGISPSEMTL